MIFVPTDRPKIANNINNAKIFELFNLSANLIGNCQECVVDNNTLTVPAMSVNLWNTVVVLTAA